MKEAKQSDKITQFQGEYRFLSNFWKSPFKVDGYVYPTNEHYYQAMKFKLSDIRDKIRNAHSPGMAKKIAHRQPKQYMRENWDEIKLSVMKKGLQAKFHQNISLAQQLLLTTPAVLEEGNNWGDTFWGVDLKTGKGENHLGRLLMEVRSEFSQDGC